MRSFAACLGSIENRSVPFSSSYGPTSPNAAPPASGRFNRTSNRVTGIRRPPPGGARGSRSSPAARQAHHLVHRAVDLDHAVARRAGLHVEPVDVLRDQGVELAALLQGDERTVPVVRLRLPSRRGEPALPRALAYLGIGHIVLQGRLLLGLGVLRPDALRAAEVRDPRVRRDPSPRERHEALGLVDPLPDGVDQRASSLATACSTTVPLKKSGFSAV